MSGIQFPNVANALLPLMQMDRQGERDRLDRERLDRHDQWMQQDRTEGRELQREQRTMQLDAAKRAQLKDAAEATTQAALGVLNTPEAERPAAYQTALQFLKSRGHDTGNLPPQYSSGMDGMLKFYVQKAESVTDFLKRQAEMPTPMGSPGGPAPGAPSTPPGGNDLDRSGTAISGIESAGGPNNGYGAVGPVANRDGNRAYGKYQVMDFNVPTWTAEVLGKPMTPQEFLANPQAQDAVFKAKFGQYAQKYGPEGAAKAWFAGEGGMNNPNASDVNGMTVAKYGQKFNAGMGGPQVADAGGFTPTNTPAQSVPGALPQVAQGDAVAGQGDVMAPPRAADEVTTLRGYVHSKIPGAQVMGVQGKPVYDAGGRVMIRLPNGQTDTIEAPKAKPKEGVPGPFGGTSIQGQSLNLLINEGVLTPRQAAELGAGKVIQLSDGSTMFFGPQGLVTQPPQAAPAGGAAPAQPGQPTAPPASNAPPGAVQLAPPKPEKPTEWQTKAAGFAQRMASSNALLDDLAVQGTSARGRFLESLGINYGQSPEYQRFEQAKRNFMNAQLRDESGAVIGPSEFMSADKQYFPQPGQASNKELLAQMAENRRQVVEAMMLKAGALKPGQRYEPPPRAPDQGSGDGTTTGAQGPKMSPEDAAKLPPGTPFIGMDGVPRVRN